jgi:hypothetical protein
MFSLQTHVYSTHEKCGPALRADARLDATRTPDPALAARVRIDAPGPSDRGLLVRNEAEGRTALLGVDRRRSQRRAHSRCGGASEPLPTTEMVHPGNSPSARSAVQPLPQARPSWCPRRTPFRRSRPLSPACPDRDGARPSARSGTRVPKATDPGAVRWIAVLGGLVLRSSSLTSLPRTSCSGCHAQGGAS